MVVLGGLRLNKFVPDPTENTSCFDLIGDANEDFLVCSVNGRCPNMWKTELAKLFGSDFVGCPPDEPVAKTTVVKKI